MKKILGLICVAFVLLGAESEARASRSSVSRSGVSRSVSRSASTRVSSPRPVSRPTVHKSAVRPTSTRTNINKSTTVNKSTKTTNVNKKNVTVNKTIINNNTTRVGSSDNGFFAGMLMGNLLSKPSTTVVGSPAVHTNGYYRDNDIVYVGEHDEVQVVGNKTIVRKGYSYLEALFYLFVVIGLLGGVYWIFRDKD